LRSRVAASGRVSGLRSGVAAYGRGE